MTPIDPKDIWIERLNRNAELEKYILDEYKGDISFLFNRKEPEHKLMNKYIRLKKVLLYITGDILPLHSVLCTAGNHFLGISSLPPHLNQ